MDWTLIISIVVGVFTGVLANITTKFFEVVMMPAYFNRVYKGIRVEGEWNVIQSDIASDSKGFAAKYILSLSLKQSAQKIDGTANAICHDIEGDTDIITYKVNGSIRDRFVQLSLHPSSPTKLAFSSFLIEVTGDGNRMTGHRVFYGLIRREIRSVAVVLKRGR